MPFANPPRSIILPADANLNDPPFIYLDGDTGVIRAVGADGSEIEIDPNALLPIISFWSEDHTNRAFMNLNGTGSVADFGINSGTFIGADGVTRRHRLFMNGSSASHVMELACIDASNQATRGGDLSITDISAVLSYSSVVDAVEPVITLSDTGINISPDAGSGGELRLNSDLLSASYVQTAQFPGAQSNNTAVFTNFGASQSINKRYTNSRLRLNGFTTMFANTAGDIAEFQMLVNGVGHRIGWMFFNAAAINSHRSVPLLGVTPTGIAAGSITVQVQWRRQTGAGTIHTDANDYFSWELSEVM